MLASREMVVATAKGWVGVPWRHQGRSLRGIDCVGLIIAVATELGFSHYDVAGYRRRVDGHAMVDHMIAAGLLERSLNERETGDILVFNDAGTDSHTAFFYRDGGVERIIHASAKNRVVVDEPLAHEWLKSMARCFSLPGVV